MATRSRAGGLLFRNRVGRRMLVLFLLCALVPVLLAGWLTFDITQRQLSTQTHDNLRRATKATGLWLYDRLLAVEDTLRVLAAGVPRSTEQSLAMTRGELAELSSRLLGLSVRYADGRGVALIGPMLSAPDLSDKERNHIAQGHTVLQITAGPNGRAQILLTRSLRVADHDALLVAEPHPDFLWRHGEDPSTRICVVTEELTYLHCPYPPDDALWAELESARDGALSGHLHHADDALHNYYWTLFLDGHFAAGKWIVLAQHGVLSGGAAARKLFLTVFPGVLLLSALLVLLVSLVQIRRFTQPLDDLTAATERLAAGWFDTRVEVKSADEFEQLGESFNAMAGNLDETFSSMEGFAEIDRVILTASSTQLVLDAVAANLHSLTNCERGAVISLPTEQHGGQLRITTRDLPFKAEQEPPPLDPMSVYATDALTRYQVLTPDDELPPCLGKLHAMPGGKTVWMPYQVDNGERGVLVCVYSERAPLTRIRERRVKDLAARLTVALADARKTEDLNRQANFDSLTGLANRNRMDAVLAEAVAQAPGDQSKVGVLFIDLDRFKSINDSLGHTHGDEFLCQVAERLRAVVPDGATVARFGGDEFVCIVPCGDADPSVRCREIARAIMLAATRPYELAGRMLAATLSIGISIFPQDGQSAPELLKHADIALYHAKASGKDTFAFYSSVFTDNASRRLEIEIALREALTTNALELVYQPQIDVATGDVHGVEALLRWPNCPLGVLSPADFIPVAEESRLIIDLGAWVLRTACAQLRVWRDQGLHGLVMSINLAPRHFLNPALPVQIADSIRENHLDASVLEVEITESSVMSDIATTSSVLDNLRALGVRVAVDDFGTGHSSLEYLARLPVDTLKIDQSFVRESVKLKSSRAIVETVIVMAHKLEMKVVAEGVESEEHLELMRENGCDLVQGHAFARPMSAKDFAAWWSRRRGRRSATLRSIEDPAVDAVSGS